MCVCFHVMDRGYGITPPAYWLLAAWHWSETGNPAYRGRYEYAKAWLLFMIKAYLIWKWEQARWLKEQWVVGQKRCRRKQIEGEEDIRKTPSNPNQRGVETGMSQLVTAALKHVSLIAAVTSADTKVIVTFETLDVELSQRRWHKSLPAHCPTPQKKKKDFNRCKL